MNADDVYLELVKIGCCSRCCLRFLGEKFCNFEDPLQSLKDLLPVTLENEVVSKKVKHNSCCVCLGLLEDSFLDLFLQHSCWRDLQEYESDSYRINLNTPPNIAIRDKAVTLYLKQKFPDFYEVNNLNENIPQTHIVFKLAFKRRFNEHCGRKYDVHSGLQLWTTLHHDNNEEEVKVMRNLETISYRRQRYSRPKTYGKNTIINILSTVDDKKFLRFVKIPPEIPSTSVRIENVTFESLPIFICGRYCKYSRLLSQTPWNLDNFDGDNTNDEFQITEASSRNITSSVQDILFDGLHQVFGFDKAKMTFSASGREDADVRCLGSGRPFFVKINSLRKSFPDELFRKLEEVVNQSPDISVFDMQQCEKVSVNQVKAGEELKKKCYIALCLIRDSRSVEETVERINRIQNNLEVEQKTPIRVAHRRTLALRTKRIHFVRALVIPGYDRIFQLTLFTQAGTYVKEFIHGDFGRTNPCLSDLTGAELDIFRLDVVGIDLDWPKHINSVPHPAMVSLKEGKHLYDHEVKPDPVDLIRSYDDVLQDVLLPVKDEPV